MAAIVTLLVMTWVRKRRERGSPFGSIASRTRRKAITDDRQNSLLSFTFIRILSRYRRFQSLFCQVDACIIWYVQRLSIHYLNKSAIVHTALWTEHTSRSAIREKPALTKCHQPSFRRAPRLQTPQTLARSGHEEFQPYKIGSRGKDFVNVQMKSSALGTTPRTPYSSGYRSRLSVLSA